MLLQVGLGSGEVSASPKTLAYVFLSASKYILASGELLCLGYFVISGSFFTLNSNLGCPPTPLQ